MFLPATPIITECIEDLYTAGPIHLVSKCLTKDIAAEMTTPLNNDQPVKMILSVSKCRIDSK